MKYVPVLRYRQQERKALRNVTLSTKTLPLIELVTAKLQVNARRTSISCLIDDITEHALPQIIVDIPTYLRIVNQTKRSVSAYLTPFYANPVSRVSEYAKLPTDRVIPTVSYNPRSLVFQSGVMTAIESGLRTAGFNRLAYRIFVPHFSQAVAEITGLVNANDIIIFDLDDADHTDQALSPMYLDIALIKQRTGCQTVIVRSAINDITNAELLSGAPVVGAVNSLLKKYSTYGFDAFGDYCGTKKDDLKDGGSISPGLIYYQWSNNLYYGFNSPVRHVREFRATIVPQLKTSSAWTSYTPQHHSNCYGCQTVNRVSAGTQSGDNQAMWKGVSIGHYLYTMEEFL